MCFIVSWVCSHWFFVLTTQKRYYYQLWLRLHSYLEGLWFHIQKTYGARNSPQLVRTVKQLSGQICIKGTRQRSELESRFYSRLLHTRKTFTVHVFCLPWPTPGFSISLCFLNARQTLDQYNWLPVRNSYHGISLSSVQYLPGSHRANYDPENNQKNKDEGNEWLMGESVGIGIMRLTRQRFPVALCQSCVFEHFTTFSAFPSVTSQNSVRHSVITDLNSQKRQHVVWSGRREAGDGAEWRVSFSLLIACL